MTSTACSARDFSEKRVRNTVYLFNSELFKEAEGLISGPNSMGFKRKIIILRIMKVIDKRMYDDLDRLNTLRKGEGDKDEEG